MLGLKGIVRVFAVLSAILLVTVDRLWLSVLYVILNVLFFMPFVLILVVLVVFFRRWATNGVIESPPGKAKSYDILVLALPAIFVAGGLFAALDSVFDYALRAAMRNILGEPGKEATITVDGVKVEDPGPLIAALRRAGPASREGKGNRGALSIYTQVEIANGRKKLILHVSGFDIYCPAYGEFGRVGTLDTDAFNQMKKYERGAKSKT